MPVMIGFDPGRDSAFGALVVLEQHRVKRVHPHDLAPEDRRGLEEVLGPLPPPTYTLRFLRRFPRDMSHPLMVNEVVEVLQNPRLPVPKTLLVDATSLGGHIMLDLFRLARVRPTAVVWHAGVKASWTGAEWHVPKARLVAALLTLVETHRIVMNPRMRFADAMLEEMRQYLREQHPTTGREIFHAPATGAYDDLISAALMACWWGERTGSRGVAMIPVIF